MVRVRFEAGAVVPAHSQCSMVEGGVFDIAISGRTERLFARDSVTKPPDAIHAR